MLDARFVFVAVALSLSGPASNVRDTLRGTTSPHRVTWGLWALEGLLVFMVEIQQRVGVASLMTLALGFVPLAVLLASFKNRQSMWRIDSLDYVCGAVSLAGILLLALAKEPTPGLVSFVAADSVAALPIVGKSWTAPESETPRIFVLGAMNTALRS